MRVFIDVGAHYGETLRVALDPAWGFDRIFALEPTAICLSLLTGYADRRLTIHPIALSSYNGTATIHGAGLLGGSLLAGKRHIVGAAETLMKEDVRVQRATEWLEQHVDPDAEIFLKLNCEGAEVAILADLLDSGAIDRIATVYVDFDIRKVESSAHLQDEIETRLRAQGVRYVSRAVSHESATVQLRRWLSRECPRIKPSAWDALRFRLGLHAPSYVRFTSLVGAVLPSNVYWWLGRRYGRIARAQKAGA